MIKVCVLTSVHLPFDIRIFHKEAQSLVQADYNVTLLAKLAKDELLIAVKKLGLKNENYCWVGKSRKSI